MKGEVKEEKPKLVSVTGMSKTQIKDKLRAVETDTFIIEKKSDEHHKLFKHHESRANDLHNRNQQLEATIAEFSKEILALQELADRITITP